MSLKKLIESIQVNLTLEYESSQWSGIAYHGNTVNPDYEQAIDTFSTQFNDQGVIWLTKDERFAQEFAESYYQSDSEDSVMIVYKCRVTLYNYCDIDYQTYQNIINSSTSDSLHDYIPALKELGYDGWITEGDVNGQPYDDIAVFEPNKSIEPLEGKVFIDGKWSKFISLSELERVIYISKFQSL